MIKKFSVIFLLLIMVFCSAYKRPYKYEIKPEKDAFYHNNLGINYLQDRIYYAAIQEFKIAISLSPSTQATAVFMNNLGEVYNYIGYPEAALTCFEDALNLYGLNLKYYFNLIDTYMYLGTAEFRMKDFEKSDNVYDKIKLGILYIKTGELRKGINTLDEICVSEPDLLITPAIRQYLKEVIEQESATLQGIKALEVK